MTKLKVKCPNCGEEVETGMEMNEEQFKKALLKGSKVECPGCGEEITWGKKDVVNRDAL